MTNKLNELTDDELKKEMARIVSAIPSFVRLNRGKLEEISRVQAKMDKAAVDASSSDEGLDILSELINANIKEMCGIPRDVSHGETVSIARNVLALMQVLLLLDDRGLLEKIRLNSHDTPLG